MTDAKARPPRGYSSWEECRDYWSLEAIFRGQLLDRRPGPRNARRYEDAAHNATYANSMCAEPYPEDPDDD